jgi:hypothetical protein
MPLSLQQRHLFLSTSPLTKSPLVTTRISDLLQSQFSESVGHTTTRQEAPPCQSRGRQMQAPFQQYQESQKVIVEGIRQQQEAQR